MFVLRLILMISISAASVNAVAAPVLQNQNCDNPIYKQAHPDKCRQGISTKTLAIGTGIGAALAAGGAAIAMGMSGGGSSGGAGESATNPPMPTLSNYNYVGGDVTAAHLASITSSAKYTQNQTQYDTIRMAYALARGYTGKNSTVAVLDSATWHGDTVAEIARGPIAPDAKIEKYNITDTSNNFYSYREIGNVIESAAHANIVNASWNTPMRANDIRSRVQISNLTDEHFISAIAQSAQNGTIFVWAAGNEGMNQPGALSALPRIIPEIKGHFINVVAWDDATQSLATFSNQCGVTMNYCITAPGAKISTDSRTISGTSFAAPIVSAAVATIREAFPYMTATQITDLLFTTARDLGEPGTDPVYGRGMLDMERATRPVGANLVPLSTGGATPLRSAHVPANIAQNVRNADLKLAFIDDYGRAFETNLSDHIKITNYGRGFEHLRHDAKQSARTGNLEYGFRRSEFLASDGLLGTDSNNIITFVAYNADFGTDDFKISVRPEIGSTHPRGRTDSLVNDFSNIYTSNITVSAQHGDWGTYIALTDKILSGNMYTRTPIGRARDGALIFQNNEISLRGSGAMEYGLSYKFITAAFVDNPIGTDEFFIIAKHRLAF